MVSDGLYLYRTHPKPALQALMETGLSTYLPKETEMARLYPNVFYTDNLWEDQADPQLDHRLYLSFNPFVAVHNRVVIRIPKSEVVQYPLVNVPSWPGLHYISTGKEPKVLVSRSSIEVAIREEWIKLMTLELDNGLNGRTGFGN